MAQYLMSVWHDEDYGAHDFSDPDLQRLFAQVSAYNDELTGAGAWVFGGGLQPRSSATTMRPTGDGKVTMTDGPYAEAKEHIGGFWVIEAPDADAALEWGRKAAAACEGVVEVRPFQTEPE